MFSAQAVDASRRRLTAWPDWGAKMRRVQPAAAGQNFIPPAVSEAAGFAQCFCRRSHREPPLKQLEALLELMHYPDRQDVVHVAERAALRVAPFVGQDDRGILIERAKKSDASTPSPRINPVSRHRATEGVEANSIG